MKCDVRHICILKKMANGRLSTPLFPPVAGSNFSTGSYTELTFQLLSLFTLLNALSFNSFAGLEKATIIKHLQNVSLVPLLSSPNVESSFSKKVVSWFRNEDVSSVLHTQTQCWWQMAVWPSHSSEKISLCLMK